MREAGCRRNWNHSQAFQCGEQICRFPPVAIFMCELQACPSQAQEKGLCMLIGHLH